MIVNPSNIPLVVKITDGKETHEVMIPARKKVNVSDGYYLHAESKNMFPQLVDDFVPPSVVKEEAVIVEPAKPEVAKAEVIDVDTTVEKTVTDRPVLSKKNS